MRAPERIVEPRNRRGWLCYLAVPVVAVVGGGGGVLVVVDHAARGLVAAALLSLAGYLAAIGLLLITHKCETMAGPVRTGAPLRPLGAGGGDVSVPLGMGPVEEDEAGTVEPAPVGTPGGALAPAALAFLASPGAA